VEGVGDNGDLPALQHHHGFEEETTTARREETTTARREETTTARREETTTARREERA